MEPTVPILRRHWTKKHVLLAAGLGVLLAVLVIAVLQLLRQRTVRRRTAAALVLGLRQAVPVM